MAQAHLKVCTKAQHSGYRRGMRLERDGIISEQRTAPAPVRGALTAPVDERERRAFGRYERFARVEAARLALQARDARRTARP